MRPLACVGLGLVLTGFGAAAEAPRVVREHHGSRYWRPDVVAGPDAFTSYWLREYLDARYAESSKELILVRVYRDAQDRPLGPAWRHHVGYGVLIWRWNEFQTSWVAEGIRFRGVTTVRIRRGPGPLVLETSPGDALSLDNVFGGAKIILLQYTGPDGGDAGMESGKDEILSVFVTAPTCPEVAAATRIAQVLKERFSSAEIFVSIAPLPLFPDGGFPFPFPFLPDSFLPPPESEYNRYCVAVCDELTGKLRCGIRPGRK